MNKKIQITAIFMALAIFGLCALIAPVCANNETTDTADTVLISEANASNESATDVAIAAINATDIETINATDIETTSTDADPEATGTDEEASPGFGIFGVMISIALLFLLIRKKA
jgi:ABC-type glycerol-3-phosphate transport system substrate-binding protein